MAMKMKAMKAMKAKKSMKKSMKKNSWMSAVSAARKQLKITGFCALNSGKQGKALYALAKKIAGK